MWIVFGGIVGMLARSIHPGKDDMGLWATILLGVVGSFVGGSINWLMGNGVGIISSSGFVMSLVGALIACYVYSQKDNIYEWIKSVSGK